RLSTGAWQMLSFIRYARPGVLCHDVWRPGRQCHRRMGTPRRHRAAKEGHGKPMQNPHGFLFAQLRAGYINPPEGYKSRKVRAVAQLTAEDLARLEREAQAAVKPNIGLSPAFQMEMHRASILKQWFAQRTQLHQQRSGHL
ncbi:MAG TPA: hypothetical protein VLQ80_27700, partial [Candidatus Saccharimonadia bacterium]|nr:hypothetical protein [Candidatus Saccharimonadia bacterium]